jgi:hypothetical protein
MAEASSFWIDGLVGGLAADQAKLACILCDLSHQPNHLGLGGWVRELDIMCEQ